MVLTGTTSTRARIDGNGEDYGPIEAWDDSAYDTNDLAFMFQDAGADSLLMRNVMALIRRQTATLT